MQKSRIASLICLLGIGCLSTAYANIVVPMNWVTAEGDHQSIGTVTLSNAKCGVLLTPQLHGLTPGTHGFHIHQAPDCGDKGMAAGGHLDPAHRNQHDGPYKATGHLGDLPVLVVDQDGNATLPTLAPRFTLSGMKGHALMIHAGSDNYADKPEKLGGGGERIACGVIK